MLKILPLSENIHAGSACFTDEYKTININFFPNYFIFFDLS
jgi:hypothetical protein